MVIDRALRRCVLASILTALTAAATACSAEESAPAPIPSAAVTGGTAPADDYLMTYLAWYRDWKWLTNRHRAELDAATERVAARYALKDTDKIVKDPEFVGVLAHESTIVGTLSQ